MVNMIDSLRLIDFAQATLHPTKVNELVETVIWAHHVNGKDVSDTHELASIAAQFGIGYDSVTRFIGDKSAKAPVPGSVEAVEAVAEGEAALAALCASDGNGTCSDRNATAVEPPPPVA